MEKFYFEDCIVGDHYPNIQYEQNFGNYQISQGLQNAQENTIGDCESHSETTDSFNNQQVNYIPKENNIAKTGVMNAHPTVENMHFSNCQNALSFESAPQYYNQAQMIPAPQNGITLSEFLILKPRQNNNAMGKRHKAHISLISTPNGIKTIVKRKRKRTMFTTEQIETLEEIFKSKPYINRDDRQVLVQKLQVSDKSVKVWFQNRRLKGKRNEQAAIAEMREGSSPDLARLDYVESQINEKTDEFGFVTLDDEVMTDLVNVIDSFLFDTCKSTAPYATRSNEICNADNSQIYEPISPASNTDSTSEEENSHLWEPNEPKESLQRLFDLQHLVSL